MIRAQSPGRRNLGGIFGDNLDKNQIKINIFLYKKAVDQAEEIKSKLDIVDVIREYIPLKPAGINFRALCPFHREKSPSFVVSPEKQIFHCFGCGKGGDVFSFVQEIESISFVDAMRLLAPKAGVELQKQNPKLSSQRNRLLDAMEIAADFYYKILITSPGAEAARKYLEKRGLSKDTISEWKIGFSPDSWDDLLNVLRRKGYSENEIFLAGLSVKKEAQQGAFSRTPSRFYNRFRGRIMFPICDVNGSIVAFTARVSPEREATEKLGKYINSPQTLIYDKSKILFGLDKAKFSIKNEDFAVFVEGQMDVITAHQNGFKNVVAFSGTAITEDHLKLIKRYTSNIAFALDSDSAGQLASSRGDDLIASKRNIKEVSEDRFGNKRVYLDKGLSYEMNVTIIEIPDGKDPDECIKKDPEIWKQAVAEKKNLMQHYFNNVFSKIDTQDIESRRNIAKILLPKIYKLTNKIDQDYWLRNLSEKIEISESVLRETLKNMKAPETNSYDNAKPSAPQIRQTREEMLSESMLALILKFSELIDYAIDHIHLDHVIGVENKSIYRNLILFYNKIKENSDTENNQNLTYSEFKDWLINQGFNLGLDSDLAESRSQKEGANRKNQLKLLDRLVLLGDKDFYSFAINDAKNELIKISGFLKKYYLVHRMKEIEKLIADSEKEGDGGRATDLMMELKNLTDEMREIN